MQQHPDGIALDVHVPEPRSERGPWAAAIALATVGAAALALALTGMLDGAPGASGPPPVVAVTPTPAPAAITATPAPAAVTVAAAGVQGTREAAVYEGATSVYIPESWMTGFYPIYATAQRTFGVNWLLIASIHRQESAFSTAPGIYKGLNFAGCCGGPMQFNVTNGSRRGSGSTWSLVSDSYRYGRRPAIYDHMTAAHPSIYDDFDSIMAAAHLLSADGAGFGLDAGAWGAAYDYYGYDAAGVAYADQVLARAIYWSQHGFCANCGTPQSLIDVVHAAYGAPVAVSLEASEAPRGKRVRGK